MSNRGNIFLKGVKLSFLECFITRCGGVENFKGKTTGDVVKVFILRPTNNFQCSYCDYLVRDENDCYTGKANAFISHAWADNFLELCEKLLNKENYRHLFSKNPDLQYEWKNKVIVSIDIFSNNQHSEEIRNADWLKTTFANAIKEIGFTLFIFTPKSITRMWCIWEIHCTIETSVLSVATRNSFEITRFLEKFYLREIGINTRNSKCYLPQDEELLKKSIEESGFDEVNNTIRKAMISDLLCTIPSWFQSIVLHLISCCLWDICVPEAFNLQYFNDFLVFVRLLIFCVIVFSILFHVVTYFSYRIPSQIRGFSPLLKCLLGIFSLMIFYFIFRNFFGIHSIYYLFEIGTNWNEIFIFQTHERFAESIVLSEISYCT